MAKNDSVRQAVAEMAWSSFQQGLSEDRLPDGYEFAVVDDARLAVVRVPGSNGRGPRRFEISVRETV